METFLTFALFLPALLLAGLVAYLCGLLRHGLGLTLVALIWVAFTLMMYSGMEHSVDWGWYLGVLVFVSAPAAIGILVGGAIGWAKGR